MKTHMPTPMPVDTAQERIDASWHWQAHLDLVLGRRDESTRLKRNRHSGPLYVQKPFYPEGKGVAHIYLLHPPGGLVSGDTLRLNVALEEQAHGLVTTPGATRMYRAREQFPVQRQYTQLALQDNAVLEWFPMEAIVYNQAHAELETTITLGDKSRILAWEITCFGLPASAEAFNQGFFRQRYIIERDNIPLFIDHLVVDQLDNSRDATKKTNVLFSASAGMQHKTVTGFFIAGPFNKDFDAKQRASLTEQLRDILIAKKLESVIAVTWVKDFCIVRYLGDSAFQARSGFSALWQDLRRALIQRQACEPRIWLT